MQSFAFFATFLIWFVSSFFLFLEERLDSVLFTPSSSPSRLIRLYVLKQKHFTNRIQSFYMYRDFLWGWFNRWNWLVVSYWYICDEMLKQGNTFHLHADSCCDVRLNHRLLVWITLCLYNVYSNQPISLLLKTYIL